MRYATIIALILLATLGTSCRNGNLMRPPKSIAKAVAPAPLRPKLPCASTQETPHFFVLGGGGAPDYNEIAIEKNVLYFQRTLKAMGFNPAQAQIYFANGNDGQKTVRYLDPAGQEKFKAPAIAGVLGPATWANIQDAMAAGRSQRIGQPSVKQPHQPIFFYFTGHGSHNRQNEDNNAMILWNEREVTVQQFATFLDQLPATTPVVTVMVQCYAGAFANLIYQKGDPRQPIALATRCGFFATVKQLPSVGCTPEVDEADYQDYSSSFFAGLSGINRVGKPVASADYNRDGRVSFAEAHAFAKVDEQAADLPISTSEAWLRDRLSAAAIATVLDQPIEGILTSARSEQKYVVTALAKKHQWNLSKSYNQNYSKLLRLIKRDEQEKTYLERLRLEIINIAAEDQLRQRQNPGELAVIDRLVQCESGFWQPKQSPPKQQAKPSRNRRLGATQ
jgi:hypothetical protein